MDAYTNDLTVAVEMVRGQLTRKPLWAVLQKIAVAIRENDHSNHVGFTFADDQYLVQFHQEWGDAAVIEAIQRAVAGQTVEAA